MEPDPRLQEQIRRFEEQLEANPDSLVFARLADLHRKAGDPARGLELLHRGLDRHPDYASGHIVRGRCLRDEGREDEAREAFERVLELDGQNLVALRALAEMARERGDREEARRRLEALLQVDPGNEPAREMLDELGGEGASPVDSTEPEGEPAPEAEDVDLPGPPGPGRGEDVGEDAGWADDDFFDEPAEDDVGASEDSEAGGFDEVELPGSEAEQPEQPEQPGGYGEIDLPEPAGPGTEEDAREGAGTVSGGDDFFDEPAEDDVGTPGHEHAEPDDEEGEPDAGGLDEVELPGSEAEPGEGPEADADGPQPEQPEKTTEPEGPGSEAPASEGRAADLPEPDEPDGPGPGEADHPTTPDRADDEDAGAGEASPEADSSWWQSFFPGGEEPAGAEEEPERPAAPPPSGDAGPTEEPEAAGGPDEEEAWDEILAAGEPAEDRTGAGSDAEEEGAEGAGEPSGDGEPAGETVPSGEDEASSPAFGEADADELRARIEELGRDVEGGAGDGDEEDDLATETLAGLYEAQGFHRQAVEMYEELVERRPEDEELRRRLERAREALEAVEGVEAGEEASREGAPRAEDAAAAPETAREQLRALLRGEALPGGEAGEP